MHVGDALLEAELSDEGGDFCIMAVTDAGKQVMLDLVVETTVDEGQECPTNIAAGCGLLVQEALGVQLALVIEHLRTLEIVADDEEKTQVEATSDVHGENPCQSLERSGLVHGQHGPAAHEKNPCETVEDAVRGQQLGHVLQVLSIPQVLKGADDILKSKHQEESKHIDVRHDWLESLSLVGLMRRKGDPIISGSWSTSLHFTWCCTT